MACCEACRSFFVRSSSFSCSTRSRWMSAEGGGSVCACARPGVSKKRGNKSPNERRSRTIQAGAPSPRSLKIRLGLGEKVGPSTEAQLRREVSPHSKRCAAHPSDQTTLPTRRTQPSTHYVTKRH